MTLTLRKILSVLFVALFLFSALIPARTAVAAEDWPVWPRKPAVAPPAAPVPPPVVPPAEEEKKKEAAAVLDTGDEAGKKAAAGMSAGTIAKYAVGFGLVFGGILAIAGGGGGGTTSGH